jgi:hypothetical protein
VVTRCLRGETCNCFSARTSDIGRLLEVHQCRSVSSSQPRLLSWLLPWSRMPLLLTVQPMSRRFNQCLAVIGGDRRTVYFGRMFKLPAGGLTPPADQFEADECRATHRWYQRARDLLEQSWLEKIHIPRQCLRTDRASTLRGSRPRAPTHHRWS